MRRGMPYADDATGGRAGVFCNIISFVKAKEEGGRSLRPRGRPDRREGSFMGAGRRLAEAARRSAWLLLLGAALLLLSVALYFIHYLVFRDAHHIFIYLLGDLAFMPIEVLLVTLIVDRLLGAREKRQTMEKMNMVIGAFFSEMGLDLLTRLIRSGSCPAEMAAGLKFNARWSDADFRRAAERVKGFDYVLDRERTDLYELRSFLTSKRDFFLRMLENPTLLEHDTFTDLLWATDHLSEELLFRRGLDDISRPDFDHLEADARRVFHLLIFEWLHYLVHLKNNYPYLFSLAVRTNPFDEEACVEIG